MTSKITIFLSILYTSLLCLACGSEEFIYPDLITEMGEITTATDGAPTLFTNDEGKSYRITDDSSIHQELFTPDSLYRMVIAYETTPDGSTIRTYQHALAIAPMPKQDNEFKELHTDPVSLQSIWLTKRYLNAIVSAKAKNQVHYYGFIENKIEQLPDGTRKLNILLYHDKNDDVEGFSRKAYLSIPLWKYEDKLSTGDEISFCINTYDHGMIERTFKIQ